MISTVILNWNRVELLRLTVESYFNTAQAGRQLFIVDNASTDNSREYLRSLEKAAQVKTFYLEANLGGDSFNVAIPFTTGDLIHLSENDQFFLAGWTDHVESAFEAFPDLGQLSLFGDTPEDDEIGEPQPSHIRLGRKGKILYEAHRNVGTSSVIRGDLFRSGGLRVKSIQHGKFRFPDDVQLSRSVKAAGYWVAWSDRYYVRNMGHEVREFEANPEYYRANYSSKPWHGVRGWVRLIEKQRRRPKPVRRSLVFPELRAVPERTPGEIGGKAGRLWSMFDGRSAEVEVLDFLYTVTRLVKPYQVLETRTWLGLSSCAVARAMIENGYGHLTTLEVEHEARSVALEAIKTRGVTDVVSAVFESSVEFTPTQRFDMVLLNSMPELLTREFRRFLPWLNPGALVLFFGCGERPQLLADAVGAAMRDGILAGVDLLTARGIFLGKVVSV